MTDSGFEMPEKINSESIKQWLYHKSIDPVGIADARNLICIECMRVCPAGDRWKNIRPKELPPQKSGGTDL